MPNEMHAIHISSSLAQGYQYDMLGTYRRGKPCEAVVEKYEEGCSKPLFVHSRRSKAVCEHYEGTNQFLSRISDVHRGSAARLNSLHPSRSLGCQDTGTLHTYSNEIYRGVTIQLTTT